MDEKELVIRHLQDLCRRSEKTGQWYYSAFLTPAEQDDWMTSPYSRNISWHFDGGRADAERQLLVAGSEDFCGQEAEVPISLLHVFPLSEKFAESLSHRDYLGAVMNLGIERKMIGDLIVREKSAYVYCLKDQTSFLISSLTRVSHTSVKAEQIPLTCPDAQPSLRLVRINIASERLDAIVAGITGLSRGNAQDLFPREKVFVNSRPMLNRNYPLKKGDILSVRGYGKVIYEGIEHETRKGRLFVQVLKYE